MPETDRERSEPQRPALEAIRFFDAPERPPVSEARAAPRVEPILDTGPTAAGAVPTGAISAGTISAGPGPEEGPVRTHAERVVVRPLEPAFDPSTSARPEPGAPSEQLARLEDKTARIEEKLARSEMNTQRVVDRFELASARMGEVALQSDLAAVKGEVSFIARRVRGLPGFSALVMTAIITAALTSAFTAALLKFIPGLIAR